MDNQQPQNSGCGCGGGSGHVTQPPQETVYVNKDMLNEQKQKLLERMQRTQKINFAEKNPVYKTNSRLFM